MWKLLVNQTKLIQDAILIKIDSGFTDMNAIYTTLEEELEIPRSTMRRAKSQLLQKYHNQLKVLEPKRKNENK